MALSIRFGRSGGDAVPAVAPSIDVAKDTLDASATLITLPSGPSYEHVEIASTGSFHFEFGDSSVTADTDSSLFVAGSKVYRVPNGATHISVIESSASSNGLPVTVTGVT